MYNVGDKIFYPLHGAGIIKAIEEKEILNKKEDYYIIETPNKVTIMVPVSNAENVGIRPIISKEEATKVVNAIDTYLNEEEEQWSVRYQENKDKLKTGDINLTSDIFQALSFKSKEKNLSTSDKKVLANAKKALFTELSYSLDISFDETDNLVNSKIDEVYNSYLENKKED